MPNDNYTPAEDPVWKVMVPRVIMEQAFDYLVDQIAEYIRQSDKPVKLVLVTTGGIYVGMRIDMLMAQKYPELISRYSYHVVDVNSYGGGEVGGYLDMRLDRMGDLEGCNVVIVDDIFDTGRTVDFLYSYCLLTRHANDVKIATMVLKEGKKAEKVKVDPDWYGVSIIDVFVAGCGLDGGENFSYTRTFPEIRYNSEKVKNMPHSPWYVPQWEDVA